jgi:hypothetical protein
MKFAIWRTREPVVLHTKQQMAAHSIEKGADRVKYILVEFELRSLKFYFDALAPLESGF